jgi:UV DNA damage endonuclease
MVKKTYDAKGLSYVSELAILNLQDTIRILEHNIKNDIMVYRMSSDSFPWFTHYSFQQLPDFNIISSLLIKIGDIVKDNGMRLSLHPGPYCVLSSENESVVIKTIDELNKHAELMDLMRLEQSHQYPINIHIGTSKPNREEAAARFCENFNKLSESCQRRLTVENDDTANLFSVRHLYDLVHQKTGIPIVIDSLHHACFDDNVSWEESLLLAHSTWDVIPICHHSSSKKINEDNTSKIEAHADFLYEPFFNHGLEVDVEFECKQKDLAVLKYRQEFGH